MSRKEELRKGKIGAVVGKGVIVFVWTLLIVMVGLISAELLLKVKWNKQKPDKRAIMAKTPRYAHLWEAYKPFTVQHINPHYLFFFPFDQKKRSELNNEVCSVNDEGFRGLGPEHAGKRKLAFILGGSSAFGHFSSSDYTTITGYLNEIQEEYFFVNAGVPSWNSTQELYRLVYQILEYEPALVITYDGANDIAIMLYYYYKGLSYPPGTPESFNKLYALVGNIRAGKHKSSTKTYWYKRFFPRLTKNFRDHFVHENRQTSQEKQMISSELINLHVKKYLNNLEIMNTLVSEHGGRFIGVFQPIMLLHENLNSEKLERYKFKEHYKQFHRLVLEKHDSSFEYLDLSNIFDSHYEQIPYRDSQIDLTDDIIFIDNVHIFDVGSKIIAREIYQYLRGK